VAAMREEFDRLMRDVTLTTLAFAIALGWSLYQLAHGVAIFFDAFFTHLPAPGDSGFSVAFSPALTSGFGLTWNVGSHIVSLDGIFVGLIELLVVLRVGVFVRSRRAAAD
jgi:hypothetical protein